MVQDSKKQNLKKAFLIYKDQLEVLELLTDEQAGKLFKAIKNFHCGIMPNLDLALQVAFLPFKNQFERDGIKYDNITERNRLNGAKGGRPKKTQENPKKADKETETEKETETKKDLLFGFDIFWNIYNKKIDKKKCEQSWKKIIKGNFTLAKIVQEKAQIYVLNTPEEKYRKNPLTWINGENWNDEALNNETKINEPKKYIPTK